VPDPCDYRHVHPQPDLLNYTMDYYLVIRKNKILLFSTIRIELEDICEMKQARHGKTSSAFSKLWKLSKKQKVVMTKGWTRGIGWIKGNWI
jgi:hypothetical protein